MGHNINYKVFKIKKIISNHHTTSEKWYNYDMI